MNANHNEFNPDTYLGGAKAPETLSALRAALLAKGERDAAALHARLAGGRIAAEPHLDSRQAERAAMTFGDGPQREDADFNDDDDDADDQNDSRVGAFICLWAVLATVAAATFGAKLLYNVMPG